MNRYHDAMEHCAPPPELEARLREAVLSAEPEPHLHPAVFRPRGFVRKTVLAAVIAAALTVSAGAVVVANWDAILASRFGAWAASTPMGQAAFQEVQITSVCDDVTLTVRQALVSEKTVYLVLDYQLPDTVDRDTVEMAYADTDWRTNSVSNPDVSYYLTGDISWEELKAADQDKWADIDWTDYTSYCDYMGRDASSLVDFRLINYTSGSSGHAESQGYDPETNTLTYLYSITAKDGSLDFTAQPLTLVVTPPVLRVDGVDTAVTDHPALPPAGQPLCPGHLVPLCHQREARRRVRPRTLREHRRPAVGHRPGVPGRHHPAGVGAGHRPYRQHQHLPG